MGNQMDKVIDGLYVGGFLGANQKEKLTTNNITHVLAIHDTAEAHWPEDFTYKCIRVADVSSTDLSPYFSECVDFIHDCRMKGGSVFVHCAAGISRSVTVTVAYLMTISKLDFSEALSVVQHCREIANPNMGFRAQLMKYQEGQLEKERQRLQESYPDSAKLNDETALKQLLARSKEAPRRQLHGIDSDDEDEEPKAKAAS